MSQNDLRPTIDWQTPDLRQSLGLCLLIALVAGLCSTHLAGENTIRPTSESSNVVSDNPVPSRMFQPLRKLPFSATDRSRMARPTAASAPAVSSSRSQNPVSTAKNSVKRDSAVVPAAYEENVGAPPENFGLSPDVSAGQFGPSPLSPMSPARPAVSGQSLVFPSDRLAPPAITGSHLNLRPGETATERSLRLMTIIAELEQQNAELAEQNDQLKSEHKAKEMQLQKAAEQISAARKALSLDQEEFQRLRKEIIDLREKFRNAERENGSLMRSLSPLLKQMLHGEDEPTVKE